MSYQQKNTKQAFRKTIFDETKTETRQSDMNINLVSEPKAKYEPETGTSRHPQINAEQRKYIEEKVIRLRSLINHQVILYIMKYDISRTLDLNKNEVQEVLKNIFQFSQSEITSLTSNINSNENISY